MLLPDLFYRAGPYEPLDVRAVFASGDVRSALGPLMGSTDNRRAATDTEWFLDLLQGRVYVGAADNDGSYRPEMGTRLVEALMRSNVDHRHDLYVGAAHGWTMSDFPVHNADAAERHWTELINLFDETLG